MENKRLTWEQIEKQYNKEWVELIDYDWPEGESYPRGGVIRTHGIDKKRFHQDCRRSPAPEISAFLFVGKKLASTDTVFSPSLIRVLPCEK